MTKTPILLYHQITAERDADDPFRLSVSPQNFEQQMSYLAKKNYRCVSLTEALRLRAEGADGRKTFAITFDDGYLDNYEVAFPILKKHGFFCTIFIVTEFVGRTLAWPGLREVSFMTWDQMSEMLPSSNEFGAHTATHPNLHEISVAEAEQEIRESKEILEQALSRPILHLAYPGGHHSPEIREIMRRAGFAEGLGVDIGPDQLYNRWRVQINGDDSLSLFRLKASGYFEMLKKIRQSSGVAHRVTQAVGGALNRWR
ncbi:MAG: polysaccharide deacetylase family protein [Anaerolineae bacterium]